ncbi:nuclear transport factor 2 family protein [Sphingobacterium lactis]|uniref:nuclear transport factor 2 family protein n=1 Tax=Sphingobacterium lactis TaxID=797291 RepID=UPI003EC60DBB
MSLTKTILTSFLTHLQNRDLVNLVNLFADNVKWTIPGNEKEIKWLGSRTMKIEIEDFFKMLWKETEPISAEIHKVLFDNDDVIIKGSFTTKMLATEKKVTSIFFIHFMINDGKITEYTLLEDSYAVSQSLIK